MKAKTMLDISFLKNVIKKLVNPVKVENMLEKLRGDDPKHPKSRWGPLTLSHGLPAGIVLFSTCDSMFPDEGWDAITHSYVVRLKEKIEEIGISNISLFSGMAGICFAISQATHGGERYQNLLQTLEDHLLKSLQYSVFAPLEEKMHLGLPSRMEHYELISGAAGIGAYFLSRRMEAPLKKILTLLVERTKPIQVGCHRVPGWYVPSHYQFIAADEREFPKGNFNLGMAHGITGILALLSLSSLQGIVVSGQVETIDLISHWIDSKRLSLQGSTFWPDRISFDEEIAGQLESKQLSFDAWCYGSAGVARSLFLASVVLKDAPLQQSAIDGFEAIANRNDRLWNLTTTTLCHGFAGTMLITHLMARDTKRSSFIEASREMQRVLLNHYDETFPFGFQDLEPADLDVFISNQTEEKEAVEMVAVEKVGLLDGVSGILLALLTMEGGRTSWAAPLLIDRSDS